MLQYMNKYLYFNDFNYGGMSASEIMLPWLIQPLLPQKGIQLTFRTFRSFTGVDVLCFNSQIIVVVVTSSNKQLL